MSTSPFVLSPSTPLHRRPHPMLKQADVDAAADSANLARISELIPLAVFTGNTYALRRLGPIALSHPGALSNISHARLILATAAAFTSGDPGSIAEILRFAQQARDNVGIVRMSLDFGAELRVSELAKSFSAVETEGAEFVAVARHVAEGRLRYLSKLVGHLSRWALPVAESVGRAALAADDLWPAVTLGARLRRYQQPQANIDLLSDALAVNPNFTPALNSICAAHVDLGQPDTGIEFLLRSLALEPDGFSGRTGRRAFREAGQPEQAARCAAIAHVHDTGQVPPDWTSADAFIAALAQVVLRAAGRAEVSQVHLSTLSTAVFAGQAPLAPVLRVVGIKTGTDR
jgi:hypothetical protein